MPKNPISVEQAKRELAEAEARLARAQRAADRLGRIEATEPANRRIVRFSGTFQPGGQVYTFVAIRADHYRGVRRWFISQNSEMAHRPVVIHSPATWVELVEFAVPGSVYVAPLEKGWKPVSNLPVSETSSSVGIGDALHHSIQGHPLDPAIVDAFFNGYSDLARPSWDDPSAGL